MAVYTLHQPRPRKGESETDPDRFVFVRDGFYFWAFVFGPLWMIRHRLWLVLLIYVVGTASLEFVLLRTGVSAAINFLVGVLIALLIGFEAATLRRWTYARRRWNSLGLVVAPDIETAERRFFDSWIARRSPPPSARPPSPSPEPAPVRIAPSATHVVGLFPEPEPRR